MKRLAQEQPDRYYYADQYNNPANPRAHEQTTAREIWEQTEGQITHFLAALGTTGTVMGTTRGLKALSPDITCIAMQPDSPLHAMEGLKHLETAIVPGIYDAGVPDRHVTASSDEAMEYRRRLAQERGLLVGTSAGGNVAAAVRLAQSLDEGVVVTVLCDTGTRYLGD